VNSLANSTYLHIHTAAASAWSHVGRVEKNAYPTCKQAPKTVAKAKQNPILMSFMEILKPPHPHKEKKQFKLL
jgi:hypothetical protein